MYHVMSTKENDFIVDYGGAAYSGELLHVFNTPVYIHITGWYVVEYPQQWDIEVNILGSLPCLADNNGQNEAFPVSLGKGI